MSVLMRCSVLRCAAVCCGVLWCVTLCCGVLRCVAKSQLDADPILFTNKLIATHCDTLQHTATAKSQVDTKESDWMPILSSLGMYSQRHTARHCKTLQDTARHCNSKLTGRYKREQLDADPILFGNELAATHCKTLQDTARHCKTLQHTATANSRVDTKESNWMPIPPSLGMHL